MDAAALRAPLSPAPPPPPKGEGEETRRGRRGESPGPSSHGGGARGRGRPGDGRRGGRGAPVPQPGAQPAPGPGRRSTDPGTWLEVFRDQSSPCLGCVPRASKARGKSAARGHRGAPGVPGALPPRFGAPCKPPGSERRLSAGQREKAGRAEAPVCPLPFSTFPLPAETGGGGRGPSPGGVRRRRGEAESLPRWPPGRKDGGRRLPEGHPRVACSRPG